MWEHGLQKRSKVPPKGSEGQSKGEIDDVSRSNSSWHHGTIHHRNTEASKGAQCGTLKIPLGAKVTNDTFGRVSKASCLSRDTPRTLTDAFSNGAPGAPDPRTSKRHPRMGLHTPKNHQDHGTSFRLPFEARLGLPNRTCDQSSFDLLPAFLLVKWGPQPSQAKPPSHG
ncbi:hypothetical protein CRG98_018026 [Punica granatum]|uniref:Uncharacterized protein n=1 Tax=Punica granatum TaxID=22663 RepID=A0A2I0K0E2_PUNGR|nr:hypothetical protein CRG98_018026 [Punica granatum]